MLGLVPLDSKIAWRLLVKNTSETVESTDQDKVRVVLDDLLPQINPDFHQIIADATNLTLTQNKDLLGQHPFKSYTSPKFHPGRIVLVGDAAHCLAVGPIGNCGVAVTLHDVVVLAAVIQEGLRGVVGGTDGMDEVERRLEWIGGEYTRLRMEVGAVGMACAQTEATTFRQPDGVWKRVVGVWKTVRKWDEIVRRGGSEARVVRVDV